MAETVLESSGPVESFYTPWEGKNYETNPRRLLILGESHYGDYAETGDATGKVLGEHVSGEISYPFLTNIQTTVSGGPSSVEQRKEFWDGVAFYNYVQRSAGPTHGIPPTTDAFAKSENAFYTQLDRLQPRVILVLSTRLWENLPGSAPRATPAAPLEVDGVFRKAWHYHHAGGRAWASWIPHPSIYFSPTRWQPWVRALLEASAL